MLSEVVDMLFALCEALSLMLFTLPSASLLMWSVACLWFCSMMMMIGSRSSCGFAVQEYAP